MASKRFQRSVSALILTAVLLSGCQAGAQKKGKDGSGGNAVTDGSTSDINNTSSDTLTSGTSEETPANTPTPAFTPTPTLSPAPKYENNSTNVDGHHEFQPHVFSTVYQNEFGGKTKEALYAYIDAVRNGDDSFPCPDENTYKWVIGHLASHFCPVGDYFVDETLATGPLYKNGTGYIYYTIPKEEVAQKQKEFEEEIVSILDDCVSDDYDDFEKVLSLYEYMCINFTYDFDKLEHLAEAEQSIYGVLQSKLGVCGEISLLYNYLLLQVGVDTDSISGTNFDGENYGINHAWVCVSLDGEYYHVDPTSGIGAKAKLDFFLTTDESRENRDGLPKDTFCFGAYGDETWKHMTFSATDNRYEELWGISHGGGAMYVGMDRENKDVICEDYSGYTFTFHYGK